MNGGKNKQVLEHTHSTSHSMFHFLHRGNLCHTFAGTHMECIVCTIASHHKDFSEQLDDLQTSKYISAYDCGPFGDTFLF
jgi:hypothetical protein